MNSKPKYSLLEAKAKLESYCAYQERCQQEIIQKLKDWGFYGEDIDILIVDLISNNFLNEQRFAESYTSGKFRIKHWGKNKIISNLKSKYISKYSIDQAIKLIEDQEYIGIINFLSEKKWPKLNGKNEWEKTQKLKRYLYGKGFEIALINEAAERVKNLN